MEHSLKVSRAAHLSVKLIRSRPRLVLGIGLAIVVFCCFGMQRLKADFSHRGYFFADDPKLVAFETFERRFGNDDAIVVGLHSPSGIFDLESAALIPKVTEALWKVGDVIRVDSLSEFRWVRAVGDEIIIEPLIPRSALSPELLAERKKIALEHPSLPGYLISPDAKTTLFLAKLRPGLDGTPDAARAVKQVQDLISKFATPADSFEIAGYPPLTVAFREATKLDFKRLTPLALLVVMATFWIVLRSLAGVVVSFLIVVLGAAMGIGIAGWLGATITPVTSMIPHIMIALGVADVLHLQVTFARALQKGMSREAAAEYTLLKNFAPTLLTSVTVALGFISFATSGIKPINELGVVVGVATMVIWVLSYCLVGPAFLLLPARRFATPTMSDATGAIQPKARSWVLTEWIYRYRATVIVAFVVACGLAGFASTRIEVNSDPIKYFAESTPIRRATESLEAKVGGVSGVEFVLDSGQVDGVKEPEFLRKVEALQKSVEEMPGVTRVVSILDVLKQTHRALNGDRPDAYALSADKGEIAQELLLYTMNLPQGVNLNDRISVKNDALRMTVLWRIPTSAERLAATETITQKARDLQLSAEPNGKQFLFWNLNRYVVNTFLSSLLSSFLSIAFIMVVALRSLKLGIIALIPNVAPLLFGGAVLWLSGQWLSFGNVLVFSVCLGISVDDTIHFISEYKRLRETGLGRYDTIEHVFAEIGPSIVWTTVVLVCTFGIFAFAEFTPNVYFGVLVAVTLTVALACDLLLLPAIMLLGARRQESAGAAERLTPAVTTS